MIRLALTMLLVTAIGGQGVRVWTGTFDPLSDPDSSLLQRFFTVCQPSVSCCCATGPATASVTATGKVSISAPVQGGAACMDMDVLAAPFRVNERRPLEASFSVMDTSITAQLSSDLQILSFSYSDNLNCQNHFVRRPAPTPQPTNFPTQNPTLEPTLQPTQWPTQFSTQQPTQQPTLQPTLQPTRSPTALTEAPDFQAVAGNAVNRLPEAQAAPTPFPKQLPPLSTKRPTPFPTPFPTRRPTSRPTEARTQQPTDYPTTGWQQQRRTPTWDRPGEHLRNPPDTRDQMPVEIRFVSDLNTEQLQSQLMPRYSSEYRLAFLAYISAVEGFQQGSSRLSAAPAWPALEFVVLHYRLLDQSTEASKSTRVYMVKSFAESQPAERFEIWEFYLLLNQQQKQRLEFRFSYKTGNSAQVTTTAWTQADAPGLQARPSPPEKSRGEVAAVTERWEGWYRTDSTCRPSASCCCGDGLIRVLPLSSNPTGHAGRPGLGDPTRAVLISGLVADAGFDSCLGYSEMSALVHVQQPGDRAVYRVPNTEYMVAYDLAANDTRLLMQSNIFHSCVTSATRVPMEGGRILKPASAVQPTLPTPPARPAPTPVTTSAPATVPPSPSLSKPTVAQPAAAVGTPAPTAEPKPVLVGVYQMDENCATRAEEGMEVCCCGIGELIISQTKNASQLMVISAVATTADDPDDEACGGQTRLKGTFSITEPRRADYFSTGISLSIIATLSEDLRTVLLVDSRSSTCINRATRTSPMPPAPVIADIDLDEAAAVDPQSTGPDGPDGPDAAIALSSSAPDQWQEGFTGHWDTDGSCVPSSRCCCGLGTIQITLPSTTFQRPDADQFNTSSIFVTSGLDGGNGCFNIPALEGWCQLTSEFTAHCLVEMSGVETETPIVVYLSLEPANNQYSLTMTNTLYPARTCTPTIAGRAASSPATRQRVSLHHCVYASCGLCMYKWGPWSLQHTLGMVYPFFMGVVYVCVFILGSILD